MLNNAKKLLTLSAMFGSIINKLHGSLTIRRGGQAKGGRQNKADSKNTRPRRNQEDAVKGLDGWAAGAKDPGETNQRTSGIGNCQKGGERYP